jgi:hypothetical protein
MVKAVEHDEAGQCAKREDVAWMWRLAQAKDEEDQQQVGERVSRPEVE